MANTGRYQRQHKRTTPLTEAELAQARVQEQQRKRFDPSYLTKADVEAMPPDIAAAKAQEISWSAEHWPENLMSATEALGDLPAGAGELVEQRPMQAADMFSDTVRGGVDHAGGEREL